MIQQVRCRSERRGVYWMELIYKHNKETAVAYTIFKEAGFEVQFATETGNAPKCDERMISGISGKLLVSIISS
jgi:hypothetical protein